MPYIVGGKCKHNRLLYCQIQLLVMKDGFIWHQNKARTIKKSFCQRKITRFSRSGPFYQKSLLRAVWLHSNHLSYPVVNQGRCKGPHACTIFVSYLRPVLIIIHLSFLLLVIRKIASFTVKQSFSCLHACSMLTVVMSKDGWKMSLCTWKRV